MEVAATGVTRRTPIPAALLGDVLHDLGRDAAAPVLRWKLGHRGTAEIEARFETCAAGWRTVARLRSPDGLDIAAATLLAEPAGADEVALTLRPALPATSWNELPDGFPLLARCVLDELAEELLWHASREGLTQRR